ncbi:unnamed protein product [Ambrosiozyma monospora]|uniref:E3 ubiquitin-protein ligase n=1 Tax=Ambrosiozyma monospora TaxID=43982 RepID=A0A9W6Z4Q6_AMBMO|nr:unnamed protein product [Ambrosiozyma monospora]
MLLKMFQNTSPLRRKLGEHVERENTAYKVYFNIAGNLYEIAKNVGKVVGGFSERTIEVENAIQILNSYLSTFPREIVEVSGETIFHHNVAVDETSFLQPLHCLLAEMCSHYQFFTIDLLQKTVTDIDMAIPELYYDLDNIPDELGMADDVLQSFVLMAQIDSKFWVRNGFEVVAQSFYNKCTLDSAGDLYLNQLGVIIEQGSSRALNNILDRFGLYECFKGFMDLNETDFEEKIGNILMSLLEFFYNLLTYRVPFDSTMTFDEFNLIKVKALLQYTMCLKPAKYSQISKQFASYTCFTDIFNEITDYLPPQGVTDYGRYKLKDSEYLKVDPISIMNIYESVDDVQSALFTNIAKIKNKKEDDIVLIPQLHKLNDDDLALFKPIGAMMKTNLFAKLIYKCLNFAVSNDNDVYLHQLLHLLHAIILDDSLYNNDESHGLSAFIDIPVGNLLLSLIEKDDVAKTIAKKASTILDLLLLKDENVLSSLVDAFGQEHIDAYKKSKLGKSFETKREKTRRLALKRQQKILKNMGKQQKAFMAKNKKYFSEEESSTKAEDTHMSKGQKDNEPRSCILCRNTENYDELFGLPALICESSAFWNLPVIESHPPELMVKEFHQHSTDQTNDSENAIKKQKIACFGTKNVKVKHVISGCSHVFQFQTLLMCPWMAS